MHLAAPHSPVVSKKKGKSGVRSPGSDDSDGSFLKDLEETLKEGQKDVAKGKQLLKKKRDHEKANERSEKGEKLKYTNTNDPILVLNQLPPATKAALMAMSVTAGEACLLQYLDRHTNMLKNELSKSVVRGEKTLYDKFEKLQQFMKLQQLTFEPQTDFY